MQIQLTNVSPEQLEALRKSFDSNEFIISASEENGKYDISIKMNGEFEAWKLFFAGGEYVMAKFNNRINQLK